MQAEQEFPAQQTPPSFREALRFWFVLGWISFGGTTGHITIMHEFLVEKKKWISNSKFFHALSACMVLPGPEAQQLAIYIGWKLHGIKGGVFSGVFFVLPSMLILLGLSILYSTYGNTAAMLAVFNGLKPAVLGIIVYATWKLGKKALVGGPHYFVALAAFVFSYFLSVPMPLILFGVVILAIFLSLATPGMLRLKKEDLPTDAQEEEYYINYRQPLENPSWKASLKLLLVFLLLWMGPFLGLGLQLDGGKFFRQIALLFTKTAFLTVGGSYTVIPYVAALVTTKLYWMTKVQMIDGFALAETTPGPLIIVVCYVGFMAASNHFGGSLAMGAIGLLTAGYFTFLPNFILIFIGSPLIERSQKSTIIRSILSLVTAAVVGVIVNLAFYLGGGILFSGNGPSLQNVDWIGLGWVLLSLLLLFRYRIKIMILVLISIGFGIIRYLVSF